MTLNPLQHPSILLLLISLKKRMFFLWTSPNVNDGLQNLLIDLHVLFNWFINCIYSHQQKLILFFFLLCVTGSTPSCCKSRKAFLLNLTPIGELWSELQRNPETVMKSKFESLISVKKKIKALPGFSTIGIIVVCTSDLY